MSNALYVVKVAGEFAAAKVAPGIEKNGDMVSVNAKLVRGPFADATKPYTLECIVDAGGGAKRRWVDWAQVQPKDGLTAVEVCWGEDRSMSNVGCVLKIYCMAGNDLIGVIATRASLPDVPERKQRLIKL